MSFSDDLDRHLQYAVANTRQQNRQVIDSTVAGALGEDIVAEVLRHARCGARSVTMRMVVDDDDAHGDRWLAYSALLNVSGYDSTTVFEPCYGWPAALQEALHRRMERCVDVECTRTTLVMAGRSQPCVRVDVSWETEIELFDARLTT